MRPVGSVLLGAIGDRWGTAVALRWSIALMTLPTVCTGLLPTYKQVGMAAPLLLTAMRLLQGLSVGGELVGAVLHTVGDASSKGNEGLLGAIVPTCATTGNLMGSVLATVMHTRLTKAQRLKWGWRVPFLAGALLGLVGIFLRTQTQQRATGASGSLLRTYTSIFRGVGVVPVSLLLRVAIVAAFMNSVFYTNFVWLGTYLSTLAPIPIPAAQAFEVVCVLQVILIVSAPLWGWVADRTGGRVWWMMGSGAVVATVITPFFSLLTKGSVSLAFVYAGALGPLLGVAISGNLFAWMVKSLEGAPSRYVAMSLCYNFGAMVGGLFPTMASALSACKSMPLAPVLPIVCLGALEVVVLLWSVRRGDGEEKKKGPEREESVLGGAGAYMAEEEDGEVEEAKGL